MALALADAFYPRAVASIAQWDCTDSNLAQNCFTALRVFQYYLFQRGLYIFGKYSYILGMFSISFSQLGILLHP